MTIVYPKPAVRDAWADTAVPTTDIVDPGNANVAAGWLQSLTPPPRQYFNWALNWPSAGVRYFMQRGVVDWDPAENYSISAIVQYNGLLYQSQTNNNVNNTPPATLSYSSSPWATLNGLVYLGAASGDSNPHNINNYALTSAVNGLLASYVLTTTLASTLNNYYTATQVQAVFLSQAAFNTAIANYALQSSLNSEAATARNASNLTSGTVPNARLPNIGSLPGVTIAADPGTTPSGAVGAMFLYY